MSPLGLQSSSRCSGKQPTSLKSKAFSDHIQQGHVVGRVGLEQLAFKPGSLIHPRLALLELGSHPICPVFVSMGNKTLGGESLIFLFLS